MRDSGKKYMELALELARKAGERTYPNPMVGAVIVKGGRVIGEGYHKKAGKDHAEIKAIKAAGRACSGAEMYVTLEPCDHHGKTPPCTQEIISSGIKKVIVAVKDPNPLNKGRGIRRLERAGISVITGLCSKEAAIINRKYIKFITQGLPYVTVKLAQSIDGKIAARDGSSRWISSKASRRYTRKKRSTFDAIVVGVNTVLKDDPLLLETEARPGRLRRIVVDSRLKTPLGSKLIKTARKAPVILVATDLAPKSRIEKFKRIKGVDLIVAKNKKFKVPIKFFLQELARCDIVNVLVEGGGELVGSLIDGSFVDEVMFFIAPMILGGEYTSVKGSGVQNISDALKLKDVEVKKSGKDIYVRGLVCSRG